MSTDNLLPARRGVVAAGNWIIDHVKMIDRWPAQDALANIASESEGNGGGPYNILKGLARLKCGFPLAGIGLPAGQHRELAAALTGSPARLDKARRAGRIKVAAERIVK